jgi:hypothetical protein
MTGIESSCSSKFSMSSSAATTRPAPDQAEIVPQSPSTGASSSGAAVLKAGERNVFIRTPSSAHSTHAHVKLLLLALVSCSVLILQSYWWMPYLRANVSQGVSNLEAASSASEHGQHEVLSDNGLTDIVQWDKYSLFVHGQRIFLW